MSNHRQLIHVNNYIFKSSLVDDAPGKLLYNDKNLKNNKSYMS